MLNLFFFMHIFNVHFCVQFGHSHAVPCNQPGPLLPLFPCHSLEIQFQKSPGLICSPYARTVVYHQSQYTVVYLQSHCIAIITQSQCTVVYQQSQWLTISNSKQWLIAIHRTQGLIHGNTMHSGSLPARIHSGLLPVTIYNGLLPISVLWFSRQLPVTSQKNVTSHYIRMPLVLIMQRNAFVSQHKQEPSWQSQCSKIHCHVLPYLSVSSSSPVKGGIFPHIQAVSFYFLSCFQDHQQGHICLKVPDRGSNL